MFNVENSSHIFVIGLYYLLLKDSSLIFVMMPQFSGGDRILGRGLVKRISLVETSSRTEVLFSSMRTSLRRTP